MNNAYSVSHIYDESGSAKARHYEFLRAAEYRQLAEAVKSQKQGIVSRFRSSVADATVGLSTRSGQAAKNLWWVPAVIAVLVALRVVIGG